METGQCNDNKTPAVKGRGFIVIALPGLHPLLLQFPLPAFRPVIPGLLSILSHLLPVENIWGDRLF